MRLMSEQGTMQPTSFRLSGGLSNHLFFSAEARRRRAMWFVSGLVKLCRPRLMGCCTRSVTFPGAKHATVVATVA